MRIKVHITVEHDNLLCSTLVYTYEYIYYVTIIFISLSLKLLVMVNCLNVLDLKLLYLCD